MHSSHCLFDDIHILSTCRLEEKVLQSPQLRTQSVRSVPGRSRTFTVINYDEPRAEDLLDVHDSDRDGSIRSHNRNDISTTLHKDELHSPALQRSSILQRSLSIHDEQVIRTAIQRQKILNAPSHGPHVGLELTRSYDNLTTENTDVYKSWDWRRNLIQVARWGRLFAKRKRHRLVNKNGECNVVHLNQQKKGQRYAIDMFTTLLELRWRYTLLMLSLAFLVVWICFAMLWWLIVFVHKDRETPCVDGVDDFATALLFSIETQQTIGYGTRAVTDECAVAILLTMIQSVFGVVIQCVLTGLVFAKLARPKRRGETIMFSKNAVISKYKSHLCLMFRIADMRKAHMICISINAILLTQKLKHTDDGAKSIGQHRLSLCTETEDLVFLALPVMVSHVIDEMSPLWELTPERLLVEDFEIVVILEGINETTGMTTQVRSSYLPGEIMWGHKLGPLITYQKKNGRYNIDYTRFDDVVPVATSEVCAKEMTLRRKSVHSVGGRMFAPQISTLQEEEDEDENIL